MEMIQTTKEWLSSVFEMKDMGEVRYVLGVEIIRNHSKRLLGLSQAAYISKVLECFQMHYSKLVDTPIERGLILSLGQCPKIDKGKETMNNVRYASAAGSLMYVMLCTQLDICFTVGLVSHYESNPGLAHWQTIKRIYRYYSRGNMVKEFSSGSQSYS